MSDQKRGKKRPKSYYIKCAAGGKKPRKSNVMSAGMKGFLVTCNKYERETVREMYNLLNEYADIMYGPEQESVSFIQIIFKIVFLNCSIWKAVGIWVISWNRHRILNQLA